MKIRLLLLGVYLAVLPVFLFVLILYQIFLYHQQASVATKALTQNTKISYNVVPVIKPESSVSLNAREARVDVLHDFFARYNSPLTDFASQIVDDADKYGLDYRLLPAIAMQESILCQRIPKNSFNCWGFGIYGGKVTRFSNFSEAIDTVSKTLAHDYNQNGLAKPSEIMSKYTPANTNDWAGNVSYIMDRIASSL